MSVSFVFTNPRHHLEMMAPVAKELGRRGVAANLVSLAEVRGFDTPSESGARRILPLNPRKYLQSIRRLLPQRRKGGSASGTSTPSPTRRTAQKLAWLGLSPLARRALSTTSVVVVPNDVVFPYVELLDLLHARSTRVVLLQEGIRFPIPANAGLPPYGTGRVDAICAWGEGSRAYFEEVGASASIHVTGSPRADAIDVDHWKQRSRELWKMLGLSNAPLVICTNPIELQGYGTASAKLALLRRFIDEVSSTLAAAGVPIVIKPHPQEDVGLLERLVADSTYAGSIRISTADPIFAVLAAARAVVVLTSTAGLEALLFDVPLGQLVIPGYPPIFEYVEQGAAVALEESSFVSGARELLREERNTRERSAFLQRHLFDRGRAVHHVATAIEQLSA